jgi:putative hydrolase of the HAD superfamily
MNYKALLLDADGTTILAPQPYSYTYAEGRGLDPAHIEPFFAGPFQDALRGKADLKELIAGDTATWQFTGDPAELLREWFAAENVVSVAALPIIAACRERGVPVFLATNQEAHRAQYLREVMFPGVFDAMLVSCELGYIKRDPEYWPLALTKIAATHPHVTPADMLYLDDNRNDVAIARTFGIDGRVFEGPQQIKQLMGLA